MLRGRVLVAPGLSYSSSAIHLTNALPGQHLKGLSQLFAEATVGRRMPSVNKKTNRVQESAPVTGIEISPNRLYTKDELLLFMGTCNNTFIAWVAAGLKPLNTGTKVKYYLGSDLLLLWKSDVTMPRKRPVNEAKNEERRKFRKGSTA